MTGSICLIDFSKFIQALIQVLKVFLVAVLKILPGIFSITLFPYALGAFNAIE
jgi:hypothetical protein